MKIASNVTEKNLSTVFRKFAEEKECNIAYIANWYFVSDNAIMSTESNALQKVIQIILSTMKNCVLYNI